MKTVLRALALAIAVSLAGLAPAAYSANQDSNRSQKEDRSKDQKKDSKSDKRDDRSDSKADNNKNDNNKNDNAKSDDNDRKGDKKAGPGRVHEPDLPQAPGMSAKKSVSASLVDRITAALKALLAAIKKAAAGAGGGGTSAPPPSTGGSAIKTLVLYDAPPNTEFEKLDFAYAIMLRNLLGHFDAQTDLVPVQDYVAGKMEGYDATFYLGGYYDNPLPKPFLADAVATSKTLVWFKYNLWQLAWDASYDFTAKKGFTLAGTRGLNVEPSAANPEPGFFDTVNYKGKSFVKYYKYDGAANAVNADPEIGVTAIATPSTVTAVVTVSNPKNNGETVPYVTRSGKFWYVADMPFSYIGPRDRYLVIADLLHDMLGVDHPESHNALVRLEDVGALVSVDAMKTLTDYLYGKKIPFSIATIPQYEDPLGAYNGGVPMSVPLSQAKNLTASLNYAVPRGAEIVMHGYTHQYGKLKNPHTGVSGDDYEFWNIVSNSPVAEDSTDWTLGRLAAGVTQLAVAGYSPVAWEAPHYHTSGLAAKAAPKVFKTTYQRVVYHTADKPNLTAAVGKDFSVGQFFPYTIKKDFYNQRVLPENLGNIEYDISTIDPTSNFNYTWQDLYLNAQYAMAVRDGVASFFFHPFWLEPEVGKPGFDDFKKLVEGVSQLGFSWIAPSKVQ